MIDKIIHKANSANNYESFASLFMSGLCQELEASIGMFYKREDKGDKTFIRPVGGFALPSAESENMSFEPGEGLPGQVALDGKPILTTSVPEGYIVVSGLGKSSPTNLLVYPFKDQNGKVVAVIELASFKDFGDEEVGLLNNLNTFVVGRINQWQ